MTRLLACGGRYYRNRAKVFSTLDRLNPSFVIVGCADGADKLVREWAKDRRVPFKEFKAEWAKWGRAAGPMRNARMLLEGKPDKGVAFPGGTGTADMMQRLCAAGIDLEVIT